MTVAADERRVRALVDYFGFVPKDLDSRPGRLPPTLILHGARDSVVPVSNAYAFQEILERQGVPHEIQIYPDQGHGFSTMAEIDAGQRTAAFLARHLGAEAAADTPSEAPRAVSS
jgi:carboxymethylenebutenolidase